jgi:hypothetical protein
MLLKNQCLFGPFAKSFASLMGIKTLPTLTKYELVKLKKVMIENAESIMAVSKMEGSREDVKTLMLTEDNYAFKRFDVKLVENDLSADDIFNLEPLFKENL